MILKYDTSFSLSFPVGKKYVIGQFHLKCGEEVSSAVDQFVNEYDIPCYFRISLLNTVENLIKQDKILTKDNDDIEIILNIKDGDIIYSTDDHQHDTTTIINQLSNQYSEKIQYWNKLIGSKESEEQKQQEERISTFLYLVDKNADTRERIINQEELFATETSILLVKKQDDLKQLNEKHSREMEDAFRNSLQPDQVELIVAQNMRQVDEFDQYYDYEINMLKQKQKLEFSKFLNDLYWLEKTKDDLDEIETFNSQQQTPQKQQQLQQQQQPQQPQPQQQQQQQQSSGGIIDSIGQNLDKGVARASSFFSFGFNKKNQTPINSPPSTPQLSSDDPNNPNNNNNNGNNNSVQSKPIGINNNGNRQRTDSQVSPPNSFNSKASSSPNKPPTTPTNNNNNSNNNINNNNTTTTTQRKLSSGSSSTNLQQQQPTTLQRKQSGGAGNIPMVVSTNSRYEDFTIGVGVQKKKIFTFKLIEESPLQLCRPITSLTGDYKKSKRVDYIKTLYSDSLSAVILIIDPSLQFNTENEKKFIKYCNMSTELHFDSIDSQIYTFKQSLLKEGLEKDNHDDNNNNNNNSEDGYNKQNLNNITLSNGDFFITKHSNLSDVQVVFHLVIDSKNRTPLGSDNQLPTTSDVSKGLRNILLTASKYGIGNITIPICLTESELDLNVTNSNLLSRCVSVLSVTRASLTSLQEMTSIKTVQFSLPSQLDSGNTIFKGPIAQKWKSAINPFLYLSN
ncbi:hypothetical protein RB653_001548 [Dictyostelium firmibasis]|uniref:Uncharacterized protein n=1 Tax=Dictyostelium firmibasis TaxID=79012 RepID=A0AAN7U490_9MYCE